MFGLLSREERKLVKAVDNMFCAYVDSDIRMNEGRESRINRDSDFMRYKKAKQALDDFRLQSIGRNIIN